MPIMIAQLKSITENEDCLNEILNPAEVEVLLCLTAVDELVVPVDLLVVL